MGDKSPRQHMSKSGKSVKEKRADKRAKTRHRDSFQDKLD